MQEQSILANNRMRPTFTLDSKGLVTLSIIKPENKRACLEQSKFSKEAEQLSWVGQEAEKDQESFGLAPALENYLAPRPQQRPNTAKATVKSIHFGLLSQSSKEPK